MLSVGNTVFVPMRYSNLMSFSFSAASPQYDILLLFTVFGFGAIIRSVMLKFNIRLSYTVLIFILGGIIGCVGVKLEIFKSYEQLSNIPTNMLIFIFLPALVFKTAYSMDYHTFTRGFWQVKNLGH